MQGDQVGEQAVLDAFGNLVALGIENGRVGHQVAHVAHEQQRTTVKGHGAAIGRCVLAVRVHGAGESLAAFADALGQVAFHQAQPVAVDDDLVVGIDGSDRVFTVHDGGQRRFHQDVFDTGGVGAADRGAGIDLDFEVQAIVLEQHGGWRGGIAVEADQLGVVTQAAVAAALEGNDQLAAFDAVSGGVDVRASGQRRGFVEEGAGEGDDLVATDLVVALAFFGAAFIADGIGAVQCVVQRAPAGVGGVQGKAGVHHRHDQLRAGHVGDLFVHVLGGGLEIVGLWQQVADFLEEAFVGYGVVGLAFACLVPGVDLGLQLVALGEQGFVLWSEVIDDLLCTRPELLGDDAGPGDGFVVHEVVQDLGDLKATDLNVSSHCLPHSAQLFRSSVLSL
ncbi:hypothetical protein D3C78_624960 [compost metagenome]